MRVILHIGQQKTGSKALQSAIHANRVFLAAQGFAYPSECGRWPLRPYEMNHHPLFQTLRNAVTAGLSEREALARVCHHLQRLLASGQCTGNAVIVSSEDPFDMHTAHEPVFSAGIVEAGARLLADAFGKFTVDVEVVCYQRRQDHLLGADYAQFIKGSSRHAPDFEQFRCSFENRLDYAVMLAPWEAAFGADRITILPYERHAMPGGIVGDGFSRVLGIGLPPVMDPFPSDLEFFNITPSRAYLESPSRPPPDTSPAYRGAQGNGYRRGRPTRRRGIRNPWQPRQALRTDRLVPPRSPRRQPHRFVWEGMRTTRTPPDWLKSLLRRGPHRPSRHTPWHS